MNRSIPTIVTNKHVVENAIGGKLRFSLKSQDGSPIWGQFYDLNLNDFEKRWIMHPDSNVDLCILPIANIHHEIEKAQKSLSYTSLSMKDIPNTEEINTTISRVEDITVIGYPDGIWDAYNNMLIVRKGITATALQLDFNNEPNFLVDDAMYGGSSGSQVYIFNQGSYSPASGGLVAGTRIKLVGIIYAVAYLFKQLILLYNNIALELFAIMTLKFYTYTQMEDINKGRNEEEQWQKDL